MTQTIAKTVAPVVKAAAPVTQTIAKTVAPVLKAAAPVAPFTTVARPAALMVPTVQSVLQMVAIQPGLEAQRSLSKRMSFASPPAAPAPLPGSPPVSPGSGTAVGNGFSGNFFFAFAVLLAMLTLGLPQVVGRRRLFAELGRPTPFVLLLVDPG